MWYWSATGGCSPRRASARISSRIEGLDWITALGAPAIQALVTSGAVQLSLFEQQEGAAMTDLGHRGQALNFPPCRWIMTTCGSPTQRTLLRRRSGAAECDDLDRSGYTGADGTVDHAWPSRQPDLRSVASSRSPSGRPHDEGRAVSMTRLQAALTLLSRALLAVVFLWAGLAKGADRQGFVVAVDAYRVLPRGLVIPVAAVLPWLEVSLGAFLALGVFVRFAGAVSAGLVLLFLGVLLQAKARGLAIDCGCFGGGGPGTGVTWLDIGRDIPLLAAALHLARWPSGPFQLDRRFSPV